MQPQLPDKTPPPRYGIDDLEVDIGKAEVYRAGQVIPLPKLSFDLLRALIEAAPTIATLDMLLDQVWPGLIVSPETVAQRVKLLRDALGDDSKQPRYILAVRGRGYRLLSLPKSLPAPPSADASSHTQVLPITATVPTPEVSPITVTREHATARPFLTRRRLLLTAVFICAAAVIAMVYMRSTRVHSITRASDQAQPVVTPTRLPPRTVAVLQFLNLGANPQDEFLASGLAESIRLKLGGLSQIVVIARSSTSAYNGKNINAATIGRELSARYLLEGTFQRHDDSVRITAQLVDAENSQNVWSVFFDRKAADIFSVQDEISAKVAQALKVTLDTSVDKRRAGLGTNNLDAYLEYLQARGLAATLTLVNLQAALLHYRRATEFDPSFSRAYSGMANAKLQMTNNFHSFDRSPDEEKSLNAEIRTMANKALELDPHNAEGYEMLGAIDPDDTQAEVYVRRAIELDPNSAHTHFLAWSLAFGNEEVSPSAVDEELQHLDKAMEIDPLEPRYPYSKANIYLFRRTTEMSKGEPLLLRSLELNPNYFPAHMRLSELRNNQGRRADAIRFAEQAVAEDPSGEEWLASRYLAIGDIGAFENISQHSTTMSFKILNLAAHRQWQTIAQLLKDAGDHVSDETLDHAGFALLMDARQSHSFDFARQILEKAANIQWDLNGMPKPKVPMLFDMHAEIEFADLLQLSGDTERAKKILEMVLVSLDTASVKFKRGERWFGPARALVFCMLGRDDECLSALQQNLNSIHVSAATLEDEPGYDRVRKDSRFAAIIEATRKQAAAELAQVREMRKQGQIPMRTNP